MAKRFNYTQRTLKELRERGILCDIVERFIAFAGKFGTRKDFMGFADIIGLDTHNKKIVAIQSTGQHGHAAHRKTILENCRKEVRWWLKCGGRLFIYSWRKLVVKRGGKAKRWTARIEEITLDHFKKGKKREKR